MFAEFVDEVEASSSTPRFSVGPATKRNVKAPPADATRRAASTNEISRREILCLPADSAYRRISFDLRPTNSRLFSHQAGFA